MGYGIMSNERDNRKNHIFFLSLDVFQVLGTSWVADK